MDCMEHVRGAQGIDENMSRACKGYIGQDRVTGETGKRREEGERNGWEEGD